MFRIEAIQLLFDEVFQIFLIIYSTSNNSESETFHMIVKYNPVK